MNEKMYSVNQYTNSVISEGSELVSSYYDETTGTSVETRQYKHTSLIKGGGQLLEATKYNNEVNGDMFSWILPVLSVGLGAYVLITEVAEAMCTQNSEKARKDGEIEK